MSAKCSSAPRILTSSPTDRVVFICDHCEAQTLLRCMNCSCVYRQPSWYYGSHRSKSRVERRRAHLSPLSPGDTFLCNTCHAQAVVPPWLSKPDQHTYVHTLVRCKSRNSEQQLVDTSPAALSRDVAAFTAKVVELQSKMEALVALAGR